jgi:hypothetical protein
MVEICKTKVIDLPTIGGAKSRPGVAIAVVQECLDSPAPAFMMFSLCFGEARVLMARRMESGFALVERELPALTGVFPADTAMRAALAEMVEGARKVEALLRAANEGSSHA